MEDAVVAENIDKSPENPVVEEVVAENSENPPAVKKNGRPAGAKDKVKSVVKSRKITIVEEPLVPVAAPSSSSSAAPKAKAEPKAKPAKVQINPEPVIQYVDRFIEHSPRTLMDIYTNHALNMQRAKRDARKEHFSNMITSRLQQLP